ncbi:hypothetical protein ACA910_005756 [Epithemia clementina (nom. ined.)]
MSQQQQQQSNAIEPRPLELSLNPVNGSLLTVPLSQVLLATTDALYQDLYNMTHGELDVTTSAQSEGGADLMNSQEEESNHHHHSHNAHPTTRRERMSNLSFAQRRHELAWRLTQHGRAVQHVAALTAANASSEFAKQVQVSSTALQHTRTAWVQADEAQDAMYFFHAQLFPARAAPHDIYGAIDVYLTGKWFDLPSDLRLAGDRYETVRESEYSRNEVKDRWQMAVRDKLLTGEVAWMMKKKQQQQQQQQLQSLGLRRRSKPPFHLFLRGGVLELRHGTPRRLGSSSSSSTELSYPIKALLTIVSSSSSSTSSTEKDEWTLLSLDVNVQAKTGEFNHQLEASNRQRYDLHRLAALAMTREEARARKRRNETLVEKPRRRNNKNQAKEMDDDRNTDSEGEEEVDNDKAEDEEADDEHEDATLVARPLHALFQVAHIFSLSWQLELLSAQALALRRGAWSAGEGSQINVTPVHFVDLDHDHHHHHNTTTMEDDDDDDDDDESYHNNLLGAMSISFWRVDDVYGPPSMGDLIMLDDDTTDKTAAVATPPPPPSLARFMDSNNNKSQLVLSIRAEKNKGIRVALSGGATILRESANTDAAPHTKETIRRLIEALSSPFSLSASDALLAATRLCTERKCAAVVAALQSGKGGIGSVGGEQFLPPWISLRAERGDLSVAPKVSYYGVSVDHDDHHQNPAPVLFRLACDARTGSFAPTFPRSMKLLRYLACNEVRATESLALRIASTPVNRRRAAGAKSTGLLVKEAFDGLVRSMNVLGQRVGVGGQWDNKDSQSASIRDRSIALACRDVTISMAKCCGLAALFGLVPIAVGTALGMNAFPDMAGEALESASGINLFPTPPLSILVDQQIMETTRSSSDGGSLKKCSLHQTLFALSFAHTNETLTIYPLHINVHLDTPSAVPRRTSCAIVPFTNSVSKHYGGFLQTEVAEAPSPKRQKVNEAGDRADTRQEELALLQVVDHVAELLSAPLRSVQTSSHD